MFPKFFVSEDWDQTGNITIYFENNISPRLYNYIRAGLAKEMPKLPKDERSEYHLEGLVSHILLKATKDGVFKIIDSSASLGPFKCQRSI